MTPAERELIDAYLDRERSGVIRPVVRDLVNTIPDPRLRRWLIAARRWERTQEPIGPHDYGRMSVEVVRNVCNHDLIARTVETHRHIAIANTSTQGYGDGINPAYLRLKAAAYLALAETIETGKPVTPTADVPYLPF